MRLGLTHSTFEAFVAGRVAAALRGVPQVEHYHDAREAEEIRRLRAEVETAAREIASDEWDYAAELAGDDPAEGLYGYGDE